MENLSKKIIPFLGSALIAGTCIFGVLLLLNKANFTLFPGIKGNLAITASTHTSTRHERRNNPILSYYQPVAVTFENKGRSEIRLSSDEIALPFDSVKKVSQKMKFIRRKELFQKVLFGTALVAFAVAVAIIADNSDQRNGRYYNNYNYVGPYYNPYYSNSYFCSTNNTYITVINYNGTLEKRENRILEPGQDVIIPPYSTVTRILACPRKGFTPNFTIEKKAKSTFFDVQINEEFTL